MLHHLSFSVSDLHRSTTFYDLVLGVLGYRRVWTDKDAVGYGKEDGKDLFALKKRTPVVSAPSPGFHLAFHAMSRQQVNSFHKAALEAGAQDNGAPGLRPHYGHHYYAAFVIDPDGYCIEAVINAPDHEAITLLSGGMKIRVASKGDALVWAKMRHELWPSLSIDHHLEEIHESLREASNAHFLVEDISDGRLLGFMELSLRPYANGCDTRPVAFLEGIWIEAAARQKGLGRLLIKAAEKWALQRGCQELGSDIDLSNTPSYGAHIAWGFEETERVIYFRKKLVGSIQAPDSV